MRSRPCLSKNERGGRCWLSRWRIAYARCMTIWRSSWDRMEPCLRVKRRGRRLETLPSRSRCSKMTTSSWSAVRSRSIWMGLTTKSRLTVEGFDRRTFDVILFPQRSHLHWCGSSGKGSNKLILRTFCWTSIFCSRPASACTGTGSLVGIVVFLLDKSGTCTLDLVRSYRPTSRPRRRIFNCTKLIFIYQLRQGACSTFFSVT